MKNGIDPKWIVLLGFLIGLEKGIGQGAVSLTDMIPALWIPKVVAWSNGLAWGGVSLMTALAALSSNATGLMVAPPSIATVANAVKATVIACALSVFMMGSPVSAASAVTPSAISLPLPLNLPFDPLKLNTIKLTGNVTKDSQLVWAKIVAASNADLSYAAAMASLANTPASSTRKTCWNAIIAVNVSANGDNLKNPDGSKMTKPDPHVFADIEGMAEVMDTMSPQGALFTSCAGAAALAKTNTLAFVNAAVTSAAAFAVMPVIPGL